MRYTVRRLTPTECERLQGFPEIISANVSEMTKDEYIAFCLASGQIVADCESGKVFTTKGPGGIKLKDKEELLGTELNGYRVVSIRVGEVKKQCRVHRVIWIAANGIPGCGMVVDHINNNKQDNRISNLQLLSPEDNSHKAKIDGLYRRGTDNPSCKVSESQKSEIVTLYDNGGITMREIAERFGISKSRVSQIIASNGWTDIGDWTDSKGKKHKAADSPRYKALGNSIAVPCFDFVLGRIREHLGDNPTLGSLFDGIGGFPLAGQRHGIKPVWASEIEEFPMAVTRVHFPEEE